jgi:type IV secretory pathway TraG/TraD family ATPase VirD4
MIDEWYQIGAIDDLATTLAAARKFKLDIFLCLNDLQQLHDLMPHMADSTLGCCGIQQFLCEGADATTSDFISRKCGEREVITYGKSVSTNPMFDYGNPSRGAMDKLGVSESKNVSLQRLILPHEIPLMRDKQIIFMPGMPPILCQKKSYFDIPELLQRARQNSFYKKGR